MTVCLVILIVFFSVSRAEHDLAGSVTRSKRYVLLPFTDNGQGRSFQFLSTRLFTWSNAAAEIRYYNIPPLERLEGWICCRNVCRVGCPRWFERHRDILSELSQNIFKKLFSSVLCDNDYNQVVQRFRAYVHRVSVVLVKDKAIPLLTSWYNGLTDVCYLKKYDETIDDCILKNNHRVCRISRLKHVEYE